MNVVNQEQLCAMNAGNTNKCGCRRCMPKERLMEYPMMILCSICGNKRCPHATDHELECTNSNEPGQRGSVYE